MTDCEHLIENALISMQRANAEKTSAYEAFRNAMNSKHNQAMLKNVSVTADELWEIAQYIIYTHDVFTRADCESELEERYGYRLDQRDYLR